MLNTIKKMGVAQPTLVSIAAVFGLQPQRIYSVAKQPIEGQAYDPKVYNWDAISRFVAKRLDPNTEFKTYEDVINKALELDAAASNKDHRRGRTASAGAGAKDMIDIGEGVMIPKRKYPVAVGDKVLMSKSNEVFEAVYVNDAAVVLKAENTLALTSLSNWTLNQRMVAPSKVNAEMIEAKHAAKAAELAAKALEQKTTPAEAPATPSAEGEPAKKTRDFGAQTK